ncbi:MAG: hypothetical protein PUD93_09745 [Lachnospiraceae bacterium]|nr:hypothetical protein [Lachnospiraceae bacterium]
MKREELVLQLEREKYTEIMERYHFSESDLPMLEMVGNYLLQEIKPEMFYECAAMVYVVVSLGESVDKLQNRYTEEGNLLEAYMVECISMELLTQAYERTGEIIYRDTGKWLSGFDFLGEKYPLSLMEDIFEVLQPEGICFNHAYMLTPKKTVVFVSQLQKERKNSMCYICSQCSNYNCINRLNESTKNVNRNMTYGYQRIFGKKER